MTLPLDTQRECRALSRYLAGVEPTAALITAYARGHSRMPAAQHGAADALDRLLVGVAVSHPLLARVADGYARLVRPTGLLRQKLVLVCALLESSPPAHRWFDTARTGSPAVAAARIAAAGLASVLAMLAGVALFVLPHLVLALTGGTARRAAA